MTMAFYLELSAVGDVNLEAGAIGAVKMTAKLISGRNRVGDKAPSGDNPHPDETGLPLFGRRRGTRPVVMVAYPIRVRT
jgi:hypothetical protein